MGLFAQRPEEKSAWAALPGEPQEADAVDHLDAPSAVDPLDIGLGLGFATEVTSIVFPVAPPAPEAAVIETAEPKD
ncbi:hypothetical protein ACW5CM_13240 [Microbacterium sp. A588]